MALQSMASDQVCAVITLSFAPNIAPRVLWVKVNFIKLMSDILTLSKILLDFLLLYCLIG